MQFPEPPPGAAFPRLLQASVPAEAAQNISEHRPTIMVSSALLTFFSVNRKIGEKTETIHAFPSLNCRFLGRSFCSSIKIDALKLRVLFGAPFNPVRSFQNVEATSLKLKQTTTSILFHVVPNSLCRDNIWSTSSCNI